MLPSFYQNTIFLLIPYYGNNDNPCYNDTLRKERELSLLPSSTLFFQLGLSILLSVLGSACPLSKGHRSTLSVSTQPCISCLANEYFKGVWGLSCHATSSPWAVSDASANKRSQEVCLCVCLVS